MAKRASRIKPPRRPKGEPLKVTVANQDRQIELLISRVESLTRIRDELTGSIGKLEDDLADSKLELQKCHRRLDAMDVVHARMQGWQDLARELLCNGRTVEITGRRLEPFPSIAPGV